VPVVKVGAVHLSYVEKGSGDPILFIPGLIGLAAQWSHQVDYFAENYRAVAFDHRGVGGSDKPVHEYTTPLLAEDAVRLLDTLGIGQAHIVGASTGGAIAQVLGPDYPSRVRSLTLVSTWARPDAYYRRVQEMRKRVLRAWVWNHTSSCPLSGLPGRCSSETCWPASRRLKRRRWNRPRR